MNEENFKYFAEYSEESLLANGIDCNERFCILNLQQKQILLILNRSKISEICSQSFDIVINLTKKYKIPNCAYNKGVIVDNLDLLNGGMHAFYFAKTAEKNFLQQIFVKNNSNMIIKSNDEIIYF